MKKFVRIAAILAVFLAAALCASRATAQEKTPPDVLKLDFENGADLKAYPMIDATKGIDVAIVPRPDGEGHCLRIRNTNPSVYCSVTFKTPFTVGRNMVLSLDHREAIEGGKGRYLGVRVTDSAKNNYLEMPKFGASWRSEEIVLGAMKSRDIGAMRTGTKVVALSMYGRAAGNSRDKNQTARMTVWLDNIRVYTGGAQVSKQTGNVRVSYTNPPMFDWRRNKEGKKERLQYSQDAAFPNGKTVTVDLDRAFYTPPKPLAPGKWFYRHWTGNEAHDAWSDYAEIVFNKEVHHYIAPEIDHAALAASPHPRFVPLYMAERESILDDNAKETLVRKAKSLARKDIPEDPPKLDYTSGRWKKRVDWISKVAAKITAPTGARLFQMGEVAALTGDPEVIELTKNRVLEVVRKWDPKGGSAMRSNDLHSAALLRGIAACYDATCDAMTPEERAEIEKNMTIRADEFYAQLNPLRGNEAQNHTWNKGTVVGIVGLALDGHVPEARDWLDCTVALYAYRFMPSMGFQGDNQEGLAYWAYGVGLMAKFTEPMYHIAKINLYKHPWMAATGEFPMYCAPVAAYMTPLGDVGGEGNHSRKGPIGTPLAGMIGTRAGDPYAMWYGGRAETVNGVTPRPPVDLAPSILFRHIGWAIFNTSIVNGAEDVMIGMRSGKYFAGHQHADMNHFFINAYGEKLAIDGGYYDWYGSPHFKSYSVQTQAHNTILVNGKGQTWKAEGGDGRITAWLDSPAFGYTSGDASNPLIYEGALKQFDRRLLFIKPGFLVVHDLLKSAKGPARFDWLMHSHTDEAMPFDEKTASFTITRPQAELRGQVLAPAGLTFGTKRSFDPAEISKRKSTEKVDDPSKVIREWTLTVTPKEKRASEEFLAVMQIARRDALATPKAAFTKIETDTALGVKIAHGDATYVVLLRRQGAKGELSAEGLTTDGDAATVEVRDGKVVRAMAIAAKSIAFGGKSLHKSAKPEDWSNDGLPEPSDSAIKGVWLDEDGKRRDLKGWVRHHPEGNMRTYWTILDIDSVRRVEVEIVGWDGKVAPFVLLNNREIQAMDKAGLIYRLTLPAGANAIAVNGRGSLEGIRIRGGGATSILKAEMLPADYAPASDAIVIEAEKPTTESDTKGQMWEKAAASGGKANCAWGHAGIWATWDFEAPADGEVEVLVRHCAATDPVIREMRMDGEDIGPKGGLYRFDATGGWSRQTNDWRYFALTDAAGKPERIALKKGKHTLRMESVDGSFNTDCFVVRPVK